MTLRWQARGPHTIVQIVATPEGVAAVDGAGMGLFREGSSDRHAEVALPGAARRVARLGAAWLALEGGARHLTRIDKAGAAKVAEGKKPIDAFATGEGGFAIARGPSVELWSDGGEERWSVDHEPCVKVAVLGAAVLAVSAEGELAFFDAADGEQTGTLRLASVELAETWHLVPLDAGRAVLALGDRLVWVDARTGKIQKRVQARARIAALATHGGLVVAGCQDGWVQAFDAASGEVRGALEAHAGGIGDVAIGPGALFTTGRASHVLCAWERRALDGKDKGAPPVSTLAARGDLLVVGERTGRARLVRGEADLAKVDLGGPVLAARIGDKGALVAASARIVVRAAPPYKAPRPLALRAVATAVAMDDAYAFAGGATGEVDVHDLERSVQVTSYQLSDGAISALARLPGALLVVGTNAIDGRLFVIDVAEAEVLHRIEAHDDAFGVTCLAADPRGRIVASGGDDSSVSLVDPHKGKLLARIRVKETPAAIAFEATGRRFACVLADGTACHVALGPKKAQVTDLGLRGATSVAWGKELVFGFADGRVERPSAASLAQTSA